MAKKSTKKDYIFAVGRRRASVARVRLHKGKGETLVNTMPVSQYFAGITGDLFNQPFLLTGTLDKYWVSAKIAGGGKKGQVVSLVHGISRALVQVDSAKFKPVLKAQGFLTRDSRTRERRKIGTGGKARRQKQSPKR